MAARLGHDARVAQPTGLRALRPSGSSGWSGSSDRPGGRIRAGSGPLRACDPRWSRVPGRPDPAAVTRSVPRPERWPPRGLRRSRANRPRCTSRARRADHPAKAFGVPARSARSTAMPSSRAGRLPAWPLVRWFAPGGSRSPGTGSTGEGARADIGGARASPWPAPDPAVAGPRRVEASEFGPAQRDTSAWTRGPMLWAERPAAKAWARAIRLGQRRGTNRAAAPRGPRGGPDPRPSSRELPAWGEAAARPYLRAGAVAHHPPPLGVVGPRATPDNRYRWRGAVTAHPVLPVARATRGSELPRYAPPLRCLARRSTAAHLASSHPPPPLPGHRER